MHSLLVALVHTRRQRKAVPQSASTLRTMRSPLCSALPFRLCPSSSHAEKQRTRPAQKEAPSQHTHLSLTQAHSSSPYRLLGTPKTCGSDQGRWAGAFKRAACAAAGRRQRAPPRWTATCQRRSCCTFTSKTHRLPVQQVAGPPMLHSSAGSGPLPSRHSHARPPQPGCRAETPQFRCTRECAVGRQR